MDKLIISPILSEKSVRELALMSNEVWEKHYSGIPGISKKTSAFLGSKFNYNSVEENIKKGALYYFVDNVKRERVGYFGAMLWDEKFATIIGIYIAPEYRGRRFGRRILRLIEWFSKARGMVGLVAVPPIIDENAVNFLKANRYSLYKKQYEDDWYGNRIEYHIMTKALMEEYNGEK